MKNIRDYPEVVKKEFNKEDAREIITFTLRNQTLGKTYESNPTTQFLEIGSTLHSSGALK